jgi:hypothetical protein
MPSIIPIVLAIIRLVVRNCAVAGVSELADGLFWLSGFSIDPEHRPPQ